VIRLTRKRLFVLAVCGLLVWVSFGALAAANTVDPSSASDTVSAFSPEPGIPVECDGISGDNLIIGTAGPDILSGQNAKDCVVGLAGNDILSGGNGTDVILGGLGDDILFGDNSNDYLDGGPGFDTCTGGPGTDTFVNCEVFVQ
jgi:Ca2+-binding RTX toxin-like protein